MICGHSTPHQCSGHTPAAVKVLTTLANTVKVYLSCSGESVEILQEGRWMAWEMQSRALLTLLTTAGSSRGLGLGASSTLCGLCFLVARLS
jgi:hypothetical protein